MNQKPCQFYSFLQAVRGNWRNALFIRCSGSLCPMIRQASCEGFLMAADAGCQPIFLSVQTVRKLSGEAVDPEECSAILECRSFRTAYTKFLEWHTSSDHVHFYSWLQIRIPTSGDSACYDAMPPSSARNGGDFIETKANQMSLLSCSRFSSACKPCVWIYSTDQRKIPVCLRQMAGLQCLCQCS